MEEIKQINQIIDIIKECNNFLSLCIKQGIKQSFTQQKTLLSMARREAYNIKQNGSKPLYRNIANRLYRQIQDTENKTDYVIKTILHG